MDIWHIPTTLLILYILNLINLIICGYWVLLLHNLFSYAIKPWISLVFPLTINQSPSNANSLETRHGRAPFLQTCEVLFQFWHVFCFLKRLKIEAFNSGFPNYWPVLPCSCTIKCNVIFPIISSPISSHTVPQEGMPLHTHVKKFRTYCHSVANERIQLEM